MSIQKKIVLMLVCSVIATACYGCTTKSIKTIETETIQTIAEEPMGLKSLPLNVDQEIRVLTKLGIFVYMKITEIDKTKISGLEMTLPNNEITSNSVEVALGDIESISLGESSTDTKYSVPSFWDSTAGRDMKFWGFLLFLSAVF